MVCLAERGEYRNQSDVDTAMQEEVGNQI
jgi:hypothetical protein